MSGPHKIASHILTIGNIEQIGVAIKGDFLAGHRETRVAMVGRSNVGKSSLINALIGGRLAQVSKQPGKTRLLHFYLWPATGKIIADLPGYGYAKASKEDRDRWSRFIAAYFDADPALRLALVLLDSRVGPTPADAEAIRFLMEQKVPLACVFTKTDSLKNQSERARRKKEANAALLALGLEPEKALWVAAKTGDGVKRLAAAIRDEIA